MTGQRRGEISKLTKEMIGEEGITAPPWLTKNGRAHSFPIANFTSCVLSKLNTVSSRLIFPARSFKSSFCGWGKRKAALDKRSGATNWTLHDLRRTFASGLQKLGVRLEVTEKRRFSNFTNSICVLWADNIGVGYQSRVERRLVTNEGLSVSQTFPPRRERKSSRLHRRARGDAVGRLHAERRLAR